jgi:hypothetical protein
MTPTQWTVVGFVIVGALIFADFVYHYRVYKVRKDALEKKQL